MNRNETTLKEILDEIIQSNPEWLGTEKAKFKILDYSNGKTLIGTIHGPGNARNILVQYIGHAEYEDEPPGYEVEWIGNKPKTKKLYAFLYKASNGIGYYSIKYYSKKDFALVGQTADLIKWLPEDQYPPIEVEV